MPLMTMLVFGFLFCNFEIMRQFIILEKLSAKFNVDRTVLLRIRFCSS